MIKIFCKLFPTERNLDLDTDSGPGPQVQRSRGNATLPGDPERGLRYYREQKPSDPSSSNSDTSLTNTKIRWWDQPVCFAERGSAERMHSLSPPVTSDVRQDESSAIRPELATAVVPERAPSPKTAETYTSPSDWPGPTPEQSQPTPETELETTTRRSMATLVFQCQEEDPKTSRGPSGPVFTLDQGKDQSTIIKFICDSGAVCHIIKSQGYCQEVFDIPEAMKITGVDKKTLFSTNLLGTVVEKVNNNTVKLERCMISANAHYNILLIRQFTKQGYKIGLTEKKISFSC